MDRYFNNPELKKSSIILLLLMIVFFFVTSFALRLQYDSLKYDYIKSLGAITARVVEKNPELEKEIIPLITKEISKEEAMKGEAILSEYGLTQDLNNELFPYMTTVIAKNNRLIILVFVIMTVILFSLNYFRFAFFYKRIRRLTLGAKKVIEGDYDISINEDREGDLSKLAISFNSMRAIIRNNIYELNNEKQFLVNLLSDISHQLKTPLSSLIVYNDIMLDKELSNEQRHTFLLNNQNQLYRMNWLIKSLLKLAKLDAKAIGFDKENQSLNETVQDSIDAVQSKAIERSVEIKFKSIEEIFFEHDRLWIEEALINIIKNCIEHTKEGGKINIELNENPVYRRIIIEDTGEGIRPEDLPNIFKRFYKGKSSNKNDSVGIGLALAKSIIESHNGMIEAQSRVDIGTKFTLTFLR